MQPRKAHPIFNGQYEVIKSLGEGNTSKVYLGRHVENGTFVRLVDKKLTSIEMLSPDATAQTLSVQLPTGFSHHCQLPWDSETFFVIGGWGDSRRDETYFIDVKTNQLTNGPSLNTARNSHACEELQVTGKSYIIVTGGSDSNYDILRSTEVLDKNNVGQGWQKGKNLKFFLNICLLDNISLHFRR